MPIKKITSKKARRSRARPKTDGQALVEYVLILTLVTLALLAVLAITGPAVGNVFSNQVYNLLGGTISPRNTLAADDFWTQVAAVASYTPESPGLVTNTPAPSTNTPTPGPTLTPSPMTPSPTPSHTPTFGPSPTPPPNNFGYPWEDDGANDDWWRHDFDGLITTEWDAEYWDYGDYGWQPNMNLMPPGSGVWTTTYDALDFYWADGVSPDPSVDDDFYARYTTTVSLEAKEYTFKMMKNNGIRIWVNGVVVVDANVPNSGDPATWVQWGSDTIQENWFERSFTATAGDNDIIVEFVEESGRAHLHVFLTDEGLLDEGDCSWAISDEAFRSSPTAWSDSPGKNYEPLSYCMLALNGYINLSGSNNPKLEFYDRYNLRSGTRAWVSVSVAGTGEWVDVELHYQETNLSWTRQVFDLTNFGGQDFSTQTITLRFILDARNSSSAYDGWWIDDITVTEEILRQYTIGFTDDMEGSSHWYPGGTWARSNEGVHSGGQAWSDSPGGDYEHGSNSILELDGIIVLNNADLPGDPVVDPELVFWHRYNLTYNDAVYVEVSTDERQTWINLTGAYDTLDQALAYRTTNWSWNQVVLSLADYTGQNIYLRFRIDARSSTYVADGWWIDDFSLRNKPTDTIVPDWCDDVEAGGGEWIADGTWTAVNGPDFNPAQSAEHTVTAHSGSIYWSDSPGADYQDGTNSSLTLRSKLDLRGTTSPQLVFWHLWDVAYSDDLYVEVSTDEGSTWNEAWHYDYHHKPPGYGSTLVDHYYDHNFSWTREPVSLEAYAGQIVNIRFRLDALYSSNVDDGWFIDDVCFSELNELTRTVPFTDNVELGENNWYLGGEWAAGTENRHDGALAFSDSHGKLYEHESNAILELKGIMDLHGAVEPTLYYWDTYWLEYQDYVLIEVRETDAAGKPLNDWQELNRVRYNTVSSWDRRQVDLSPYIDKYIRLRFRLYAVYDTRVGGGWWLDDISIIDRNGIEQEHPLPFVEDGEDINPYWVYDGTWDRIEAFRPIGSGSGLGPGGWDVQIWNDDNRNRTFDDGSPECTGIQAEIDRNFWGGSAYGCSAAGTDYYLIRYTRVITVSDENGMGLAAQAQSDDGIRVFVDGQPMLDHSVTWVDRGFNSTPDEGPIFDLTQGDHTLVVEYYERAGDAQIRVNFGVAGYIFADSPDGNYFHQNDMSLHLEGKIDLTGTSNPALSFWETRYMHWSDSVRVEISTDEGFTWNSIYSSSSDYSTWRKLLLDLSGYAGQKITIRFRLDARSDTRVDDGWYIDDIVVAE
ncbi:MAG: hypothetical protein JXQ72_16260 [Anaerolineae bacterium]|nr:hypothetical protein [Anaerolineae bacterium]